MPVVIRCTAHGRRRGIASQYLSHCEGVRGGGVVVENGWMPGEERLPVFWARWRFSADMIATKTVAQDAHHAAGQGCGVFIFVCTRACPLELPYGTARLTSPVPLFLFPCTVDHDITASWHHDVVAVSSSSRWFSQAQAQQIWHPNA